MRPDKYLAPLCALAFLACDSTDELDGGTLPPGVDASADAGTPVDSGPIDVGPVFAESAKANLRIKSNLRLRNDLAQALGLAPNEVCLEMGQYSCTDFVHAVALGGVEPYTLGLNEPQSHTTLTTPIAVERVVMAACTKRALDDLGSAQPVIWKDLGIAADGKLADPGTAGVTNSITTLYQRGLLRDPKAREIEHLTQLYRDLEADGGANPARDWAILTCFSVLTSLEALFY
ncbi:MAG: hypothetical protein IPG45_24040 [Deltaproteobacteria bacterium]|nr:hypothetical protein [Deltaproteobacteria bacterium]